MVVLGTFNQSIELCVYKWKCCDRMTVTATIIITTTTMNVDNVGGSGSGSAVAGNDNGS